MISVTVDTVRGQLLYEIQGPFYYNPDVIADLSSIRFEQTGHNQVHVSGFKGKTYPSLTRLSHPRLS